MGQAVRVAPGCAYFATTGERTGMEDERILTEKSRSTATFSLARFVSGVHMRETRNTEQLDAQKPKGFSLVGRKTGAPGRSPIIPDAIFVLEQSPDRLVVHPKGN